MGFKMKGSPAKIGGIHGTTGHVSALKKLAEEQEAAASALKHSGKDGGMHHVNVTGESDHYFWEDSKHDRDKRYNKEDNRRKEEQKKKKDSETYSKAKSRDENLDSYIKKRKTLEKGSDEWKRNQNKINEAYGVKKRYEVSDKVETKTDTKKDATDVKYKDKNLGEDSERTYTKVKTKGPDDRVKRETYDYETESGKRGEVDIKYRKDSDKKRLKHTQEDLKTKSGITGSKGETDKVSKFKYDKEGRKKKSKVKYKTDYEGGGKGKGRVKRKYDEEGNVIKSKQVHKEDGRRYVKKTDAAGNVTVKSRRTLKGLLTGKGKEDKSIKKEE